MKNEKEFEAYAIRSASQVMGACVVPIPDDAKKLTQFCPELASLIERKVYDFGVLYRGRYTAVEAKFVREGFSFNCSAVEPHQLENLLKVDRCGGAGVVLVGFHRTLLAHQLKRTDIPEDCRQGRVLSAVFAIPAESLFDGSFTLEEMYNYGFFVPQGEGRLLIERIL